MACGTIDGSYICGPGETIIGYCVGVDGERTPIIGNSGLDQLAGFKSKDGVLLKHPSRDHGAPSS